MSNIYKPGSGGGGGLPPNVATTYTADQGSSTPAANIENIIGSTTASTVTLNPISTQGTGNSHIIHWNNQLPFIGVSSGLQNLTTADYGAVYTVPGGGTVNLPSSGESKMFYVSDGDGNAATNPITVLPPVGDTIIGQSSFIIDQAYQSAIFMNVPNNEWIVWAQASNIRSGISRNISSPTIDFKTTGPTPIFTATGNFIITGLIMYSTNIVGTISGSTGNLGWTAPNYDDWTGGGITNTNSATGQYASLALNGNTAVPSGQTLTVNMTVADTTSTTNEGVLIVQGFYV